jgi:hypothetical protein
MERNLEVRNVDIIFEWTPLHKDKNRTQIRLVRLLRNFETWMIFFLNGQALRPVVNYPPTLVGGLEALFKISIEPLKSGENPEKGRMR